MSYLPTRCDSCHRVDLAALARFQREPEACRFCGQPLRPIPSCVYPAADVEQFRELSDIVAESRLSSDEALTFSREVARALWSHVHGSVFEILSVRLPGILPLQLVTGTNVDAQHRLFRMLHTIFEGLALPDRSTPVPVPTELPSSLHA